MTETGFCVIYAQKGIPEATELRPVGFVSEQAEWRGNPE